MISLLSTLIKRRKPVLEAKKGVIFYYRKPRLRPTLIIVFILSGLACGLYLSFQVVQDDLSHLARIPHMITTPGGDTQRHSDKYQETVQLANQKNIASVEETSESYILIPEVVTETIASEEITIPLPWSSDSQETSTDHDQVVSNGGTGPINSEGISNSENNNPQEELLKELNNSAHINTIHTDQTFSQNFETAQTKEELSGHETVMSFSQGSDHDNLDLPASNARNGTTPKQSKYALAILNQMNAIANGLAVQTPETGFFTRQDNHKPSTLELSDPLGNVSGTDVMDSNGSNELAEPNKTIPAGTIYYGEVISEINSDMTSPILAEITEGPFKGWRLTGSFNIPQGSKGLLLSFNKFVNLEGKEFTISALAIDGLEGQSLIASEVNPRLLQRYGPVFATSFLAGLAQSLSQPRSTIAGIGSTQVLVEEPSTLEQAGYAGLSNSFSAISSDIANYIPKGPLITIKSGYPLGILFTNSATNLS